VKQEIFENWGFGIIPASSGMIQDKTFGLPPLQVNESE